MLGVELHPILSEGKVANSHLVLPDVAKDVFEATAELYETVGWVPPWICYLAVIDSQAVGTCGFKRPPLLQRVEIAYFTFPEFQGRGIATEMARQLIRIAEEADVEVKVVARTLMERNSSHRVLEKLGFAQSGPVDTDDDGTVLEWRAA